MPKYDEVEEYVEVPVDENGNEIKDERGKSGSGRLWIIITIGLTC